MRYSGDLVLPLVGGQAIGVDVLQPDEHAPHSRTRALLDEVGELVTKRVHLNEESPASASRTPRREMIRSRITSHSLLRAKLSSVMKKLCSPCATFSRMIFRCRHERRRDFRPWTLMIVQKEHWNGQPRPASKLVTWPAVRAARTALISGIASLRCWVDPP